MNPSYDQFIVRIINGFTRYEVFGNNRLIRAVDFENIMF